MWNPPIDEEQVSLEPRPQPPVSQDSEPCPQLQLPTVLTNIEVTVTHFTSPGSFFVQLAQNEALFERSVQKHLGTRPYESVSSSGGAHAV